MARETELQRQRKAALRAYRRTQRRADTLIERVERRIFQLLDRKTLIVNEDLQSLVNFHNEFIAQVRVMERDLVSLIEITFS